jgi:hypothetical protein
MLTPEQIWAVIVAVAGTIAGAVTYLIKPVMDSARKRNEEDAAAQRAQVQQDARHRDERADLEKAYLTQSTISAKLTAETNAKQAADLAAQTAHLHLMATAIASVNSKTDAFHEAFREFVNFGKQIIKMIPDKDAQDEARDYLDKIVGILGHKRQ